MIKDTDIAWLAGIVDGEGCFSVKKPVVRRGTRTGTTPHTVWLVVCNTSRPMMVQMHSIIEGLLGHAPRIRRVWKGKKATRYQYWINVAQKDDLLLITEALIPHLVAKKFEAECVRWFLKRQCSTRAYKRTEADKLVLEALSAVKRNGGEAPVEIVKMLRAVIPSEAFLSSLSTDEIVDGDDGNERVETSRLSLNDNADHECPTTH